MLKIIIMAILLFILVFVPSISFAIEEDPLKDMDMGFLVEETSVEDTTQFLSISGYLESRNQLIDISVKHSGMRISFFLKNLDIELFFC